MKEKTNVRDSYKLYRDNNELVVPRVIYLEIVFKFIKFIMDKVFEGYDVKLLMLGIIGIRSRKVVPKIDIGNDGKEYITGLAPNWRKTKELWKEKADELGISYENYISTIPKEKRPPPVLCFNEHSNGLIYNIMWYNHDVIIKNRTLYSLRFSRENKRRLSRMIMKGEAEFLDIKSK